MRPDDHMRRLSKWLICMVLVIPGWGLEARAEEVPATQAHAQADHQADHQADQQADHQADHQADTQADTQADAQADTQADARAATSAGQASTAPSVGQGGAVSTTQPSPLTDEQLAALADGEAIEIFDERPDKPFDRDTTIRLTGEQLAARGATDLGSALALLPDVTVRDAGRGGFNVDIRGARKGAVSVLVDGVLVTDPYYGTFDVSTIPITDIVQIRVSTTPMSPIDGPGGPGGVIEVITRDAVGEQLVIVRALGDSLPSAAVTGTARAALARRLALRVAMSGLAGARDLALPAGAAIDEGRRSATGTARLEYRDAANRLVLDGFVDDRSYVSPPSETNPRSPILVIDRETTLRASAKLDARRGRLQLQSQAWLHRLARRSRYFADASLATAGSFEDLGSLRAGAQALATRPIGKDARWAAATTIDHTRGDVNNSVAGVRGQVTLVEAAANVQYERRTVRVDAAAGLAIPLGIGAAPWPEAKLVARWRPAFGPLELIATGARKGRVPSLRERFDPGSGNAALSPEYASHGELRAVYDVASCVRVEVAPYYRRTTGTVRVSADPVDMGRFTNLGELTILGIDTQARVTLPRAVELGGAYGYVDAEGETADPLDRLPHHRADAWLQARPLAGVSLLARARYVGAALDKQVTVPSYTLVELTATARLSSDYLAVLRIDDALDARPETRAGYFMPGRVAMVVLQGQWR